MIYTDREWAQLGHSEARVQWWIAAFLAAVLSVWAMFG